jgi:hypothetical protein
MGNMPETKEQPSRNPTRGNIPDSGVANQFIKKNPLASRYLAIQDWGESPWKISLIVSEAILALERESGNAKKKELAAQAVKAMKARIGAARQLYKEIFEKNGGEIEASLKLRDDISFMENMYNIIEAQVNGLVSRQGSWKARVRDLGERYTKQALISTPWENIRKKNPWITLAMGAGVGAAMWFTNGWNAAVQMTQYVLQLGHQSAFILERIKPITDFAAAVVSTLGVGALFYKFSKSEALQRFYSKHIKGNQDAIKKHASWIGAVAGMAAGFSLFTSSQLDGVITAFQQLWKTLHTDPAIKQFISPIAEFFWNVGGMIFFGWGVNKLDRDSLKRKEKLADECEKKQLAIVEEEKLFRRKTIAIIKQKAILLSALYGYCAELDAVDPEISALAEAGDFRKINEIHKARMQEIFKDEQVPDYLLEAASMDSTSTDNIPGAPAAKTSKETPPGQPTESTN